MKRAIRLLILLIGVVALAWGTALLTLGLTGESATPRNVTVRRTGGERDETTPNRYTYAIRYEFLTRNGTVASGHAQVIGDSFSARTPGRIRYFATAPWINAPEDHCGFAVYPFALLAIGGLLGWASFGRRGRRAQASSGRLRRRRPRPVPVGAGTAAATAVPDELSESAFVPAGNAEAAQAWLRRYRSHSRRYAWLFVLGVVLAIGTIVRIELGEWSSDWLYSTAFAGGLTWVLAWFTRRTAESAWTGEVVSREIRQLRDDNSAGNTRVSHIIHVRTDVGKMRKLRVTPDLFEVYPEGTFVRKVRGLSFPLPETDDDLPVLCPVCGGRLDEPTPSCPRCRAPVFRPADLP